MRKLFVGLLAVFSFITASADTVTKTQLCDRSGQSCTAPSGTVLAEPVTIVGPDGTKLPVLTTDPLESTPGASVRCVQPHPQKAAFGAMKVSEERPIAYLNFHYNINSYFATTTTANGGTATQSNSKAVLQTSTATNGSAKVESKAAVRYVPGQGIFAKFTAVFTACTASSTQEIGIGDDTDGFFFGCYGGAFGINRRQNGSDNTVAQTAWNYDKMAGAGPTGQTLDITKGNVYGVQFQWLGFGSIHFYVEDSATGDLYLVHTINYANANTDPSIFNPTLPLHAKVVNSGNATNLTLQTPSMGAYTEGREPESAGSPAAASNAVSAVTNVELPILSIQNVTTFQGLPNRVRIRLSNLSYVDDAPATILYTIRVRLNATLTGASFANFDANTSVASVDTSASATSGGRIIWVGIATQVTTTTPLDASELELNPGDIVTVTAQRPIGAGGNDVAVGLSWTEKF